MFGLYTRVWTLSWTESWIPPFYCLVYKTGIIIRIVKGSPYEEPRCTVLFDNGLPLTTEYTFAELTPATNPDNSNRSTKP